MAKVNWIGIIDEEEIDKYQKGELHSKAVRMKMPKTMNEMMLKGLPFIIPAFIILVASMYVKTYFSKQNVINIPFIFIGTAIGFVLLIVHEFLHAIVYPKGVNTYIGIVKPINFVALASYPLHKKRFILMCILPYILGIIPLVAFWISPANLVNVNGILFGMACMGMTSPCTDAYNVYQVIKQVPKDRKVQFYGNDTYYI